MTALNESRRRVRVRRLASDARAGTWARQQARRRQWEFTRSIWRIIVVTAAFLAAATTASVFLVANPFVRGLVVGGLWVAAGMALLMLVSQATGASSTNMGALAEQWTASELRPMRTSGWAVINHFSLRQSDIDHVVFGQGGIFAIETKWSASGWDVGRPNGFLRSALDQVRRNAQDLRMWKEVKATGVNEVRPVLFLWGGFSVDKPPEPILIDGVTVIYGRSAAKAWRTTAATGHPAVIDDAALERLWAALDKQITIRDDLERAEHQPLPSLERIWWTALGVFVIGSSSLFLSIWVLQLLHSWWQWGIAAVGAAFASLLLRRQRALRPFAVGWLVGLLGSVTVIISLFAASH